MSDTPKHSYTHQAGFVIAGVPHAAALNMSIIKLEESEVICKVPYDEKLVGNPDTGVIHGGVISSLLDNACGIAVTAKTKAFGSIATLDLRIDYMRPATPKEDIIATAECFRVTRSIAFVRGVAHHGDPKDPIATCTAAFMMKPREVKIAGDAKKDTA